MSRRAPDCSDSKQRSEALHLRILWNELPDDVRMIYGNRKPYAVVFKAFVAAMRLGAAANAPV